MELLVFLIPFFVSAVLLSLFRKQTTWWEHAILIIPSLLVGVAMIWAFERVESSDTEYLGSYVTKIRYYEPWNEQKEHTEIYTDDKGESHTRTYYTMVNHPERWTYYDHSGRERKCSNEDFSAMKRRLSVASVFVDMHRHYYTRDGDAYEYRWNGQPATLYSVTREHEYENKVKASRSVFKFEDISEKEARRLGLHDYPKIRFATSRLSSEQSSLPVRSEQSVCSTPDTDRKRSFAFTFSSTATSRYPLPTVNALTGREATRTNLWCA
jgi:hypothetical protein